MSKAVKNFVAVDDILEAALEGIRKHWLVRNPVVVGANGNTPIGITRFRNYAGVDLGNTQGLTCSVYPYTFTDKPTVDTGNASVVLDPYELGTNVRLSGARDASQINIAVELSLQGYGVTTLTDAETGQTLQSNHPERILRRWADIVALILKSDLAKLGGMVCGSSIKFMNFSSTNYEEGAGRNFVLHRALLLWQTDYYPVREWLLGPPVRPEHVLVGITPDGEPVWWRDDQQVLAYGNGVQMLRTPTGLRLSWNPETQELFNPDTEVAFDPNGTDLQDPGTGRPIIDTDVLVVGYLPETEEYLYYRISTETLFHGEDVTVNQLPDGRPLGYDPQTHEFVQPTTGSAYRLKDFLHPATGKVWLLADWTLGFTPDDDDTRSDRLVL